MGRPETGDWEFPRGFVKEGESNEAAMRRVAHENLGLTLDIHTGQPPLASDYQGRSVVYRYFIARVLTGTPAPRGYHELRWMTLQDLRREPLDPLSRHVAAWYAAGGDG